MRSPRGDESFMLFLLCCFTHILCTISKEMPIIRNVWRGGVHSEGPHWSTSEQALYWVDIKSQNVHRYDPATEQVTTKHINYGPTTPVIPIANAPGKFVLGVRSELYVLSFDSASQGDEDLRLITALDLGHPDNRMNDGKVDAMGRLWVGTMGKEVNGNVDSDKATFYMVTQHNYLNPEVKVRPVSISNGITWTKNNKYMFYIDTPTRRVDVFDFDLKTGSICNRRPIFDFAANNITGYPDGMTIDSDDNIWIACYNGAKVIKVDSRSGRLLQLHTLPADEVTSVSWGGPGLDILYVTTSKHNLTPLQAAQQTQAGSVFSIEGTGSKGLPANEFVFDPKY